MKHPITIATLPAIAVCAALVAAPAHAAWSDGQGLAPEIAAVHYEPAAQGSVPPPNQAVWYHPRGSGYSDPEMKTAFELFGGAYSPKGQIEPTSSDFGFRVGPLVTNQVQLGLAADWIYRHYADRVNAGASYQEAGSTVSPEHLVAESSSHLFPMSLFLQFKLPLGPIAPYAGAGAGYEVLYLTAQNHDTGANYDATFGGWGWQTWAGMKLSLGGVVRLNGELFLNQCTVERDVQSPAGQSYQERVEVTGGGARVGMAFGF